MSEFILHHYALSPFSEKVRVMLGYAGLSWQSVTTEEMPPRPLLAPLAGGYRKIPVAQIGADVFCDTRTITREIARLAGKPELSLEGVNNEVKAFVEKADLELFLAVMMSSVGLRVNIKLFRAMSLGQLFRFFKDRIHIGRTSNVPRMTLRQARDTTRLHLVDLEKRLQAQAWLFGEQPCIADFSAYHSLWFLREVAESKLLDEFSSVLAWMDRVKAFGHGSSTSLSPEAALTIARQSVPESLPESPAASTLLGSAVTVTPSDYGQVPCSGELRYLDATRVVLAHHNSGDAVVHVHLPVEGFDIVRVHQE